ncbi:zinc finger protein 813-like isoform X1 [Gadus macrocephalus]|uniref:zinc finger protein 813-like isoform X1 n=1 Tax=Gadus macrocephalus TaxID=80720 RepID=UPI0028CB73B7|nr:zinc finger protein 813-like isoform X1 [Gadus macrocephalus]
MAINMSPCDSTLEEQLSSIMDVLAKAAVSEICQLFSEGSTTLRIQITQSLKENEALRTRMKVMRSELFSLRLQTRSNGSRAASRFALARANICKSRTKSLGNDLKPQMDHKEVANSPSHSPSISEDSSVTTQAEPQNADIILIKDEEDIGGGMPALEDCDAFGDRSRQGGATSESLHVDAPGSSHMSSHDSDLRILSVHGKGEGPLAVDANDNLFTASELEALSSLSPDHSITHDSLLSFTSGPSERAPSQGTQDSRGGPGRDGQVERLQHFLAASRSLKHAALAAGDKERQPGQLSTQFPLQPNLVFPQGVAKSLEGCGRFVRRDELVMHRVHHKGTMPIPCALCGKVLASKAKLTMHMRIHTGEKPYGCIECGKHFTQGGNLKIHLRTHSGEKPCKCQQCNASFSDPSSLRRHMVKHTG